MKRQTIYSWFLLQILTDALETEKKENESLKEEIEELRRQQLLAGGTAIVASVQSSRQVKTFCQASTEQ